MIDSSVLHSDVIINLASTWLDKNTTCWAVFGLWLSKLNFPSSIHQSQFLNKCVRDRPCSLHLSISLGTLQLNRFQQHQTYLMLRARRWKDLQYGPVCFGLWVYMNKQSVCTLMLYIQTGWMQEETNANLSSRYSKCKHDFWRDLKHLTCNWNQWVTAWINVLYWMYWQWIDPTSKNWQLLVFFSLLLPLFCHE